MRVLVALVLVAGCSTPPAAQSEWERETHKPTAAEAEPELPAYPVPARLVQFEKGGTGATRLFIDSTTLSVKDGVVRYVLVAQSADGVQSVSYEGLRCDTAQFRQYAFGHPDGTWSRSRTGWRPLGEAQPRQYVLATDYFCPQKVAIHDAAEGLRALQEGGNPYATGFGNPLGR